MTHDYPVYAEDDVMRVLTREFQPIGSLRLTPDGFVHATPTNDDPRADGRASAIFHSQGEAFTWLVLPFEGEGA